MAEALNSTGRGRPHLKLVTPNPAWGTVSDMENGICTVSDLSYAIVCIAEDAGALDDGRRQAVHRLAALIGETAQALGDKLDAALRAAKHQVTA